MPKFDWIVEAIVVAVLLFVFLTLLSLFIAFLNSNLGATTKGTTKKGGKGGFDYDYNRRFPPNRKMDYYEADYEEAVLPTKPAKAYYNYE